MASKKLQDFRARLAARIQGQPVTPAVGTNVERIGSRGIVVCKRDPRGEVTSRELVTWESIRIVALGAGDDDTYVVSATLKDSGHPELPLAPVRHLALTNHLSRDEAMEQERRLAKGMERYAKGSTGLRPVLLSVIGTAVFIIGGSLLVSALAGGAQAQAQAPRAKMSVAGDGIPAGLTKEQFETFLRAQAEAGVGDALVQSGHAAPVPTPALPQVQQQAPVKADDGRLSLTELTEMAKRGTFLSLGNAQGKGRPFFVFTDPHCPACRSLEPILEQMADQGYRPMLIPVSFKKGSEEATARALCKSSDADRKLKWQEATHDMDEGPTCAKGLEQAKANNKLFLDLRLSGTPTFVSVRGDVVASFGTIDDVKAWVDSTTPATDVSTSQGKK